MSVRENFADIYLRGMRDRSMRSGTELAREIQRTDWSTAGNLSNRSSGVQIPRDICTHFGRYLLDNNIIYYIIQFYLLSLATERTFEIIQIQSPEHGTKEIFSFDQSIHFQYQTRLVIEPHPLITDVSIRGSHCIVLYHCQTHLAYLVIGQESPFPSVLPRGSLSSCWRSKPILGRVG